jgi:hypothetical protein
MPLRFSSSRVAASRSCRSRRAVCRHSIPPKVIAIDGGTHRPVRRAALQMVFDPFRVVCCRELMPWR